MIKSPHIKSLILKYAKSTSWSFTSSNIQEFILNEWSVLIPNHQIWKQLKNHLHLSYKKGSSRPCSLNFDNIKLLKQLFWVRLAQRVPHIIMLINLDGSTINKDVKNNYSWLKIEKHCSINNIVFKSSINLISWIITSGLAYNWLKYTTSNSAIPTKFLKQLFEDLKQNGITPEDTEVLLDS